MSKIGAKSFDFLKKHVFSSSLNHEESRHLFRAVDAAAITKAEIEMSMKLPFELIEFYRQIGCGYFASERGLFNRLMGPGAVADFRLGRDVYEYKPDGEPYPDPTFLVFFEVAESTFLAINTNEIDQHGNSPIFYFDKKIATSLEEFVKKMDKTPDYFIDM